MDKKELFKAFIANHPELINYIKNKEMTFQDFYEIYDIYGDDENTWRKYFKNSTVSKVDDIKNIIKNVNMDNVEKHINNAQKAIGIIGELTKKDAVNLKTVARPLTKFFGD